MGMKVPEKGYPINYTDFEHRRNTENVPLLLVALLVAPLASTRLRRDNSSDGEAVSRVPDGRGLRLTIL